MSGFTLHTAHQNAHNANLLRENIRVYTIRGKSLITRWSEEYRKDNQKHFESYDIFVN